VEWLLWWSWSRFEKCLAKRLHQLDWDCKKSKLPFPTFFSFSPLLFCFSLFSSPLFFLFPFPFSPLLFFISSSPPYSTRASSCRPRPAPARGFPGTPLPHPTPPGPLPLKVHLGS
jgi:hypothetical protein